MLSCYNDFSSNKTMTGFEYFSLVFFIHLSQYYKDSKYIPIVTFVCGILTVVFMIAGK